MPLNTANMVPNTGVIHAADILQYANLFTGVMTDQPVNIQNTIQTAGKVGVGGAPPSTSGLMIYGGLAVTMTASGPTYAGMAIAVGGALLLGTGNADPPTARWSIQTGGHFFAQVDNTYDIGATGGSRPRSIYAGTSISAPTLTVTTLNATNENVSGLSTLTNLTVTGTPIFNNLIQAKNGMSMPNSVAIEVGNSVGTLFPALAMGSDNLLYLFNGPQGFGIQNNANTARILAFDNSGNLTISGAMNALNGYQGSPYQVGAQVQNVLKTMPNDANSVLLTGSSWVNVATFAVNGPMLSSNAYYDGSAWQRGSSTSGLPGMMNMGGGAFGWYNVPAGSGAMPAWTQRMGLDTGGNLTLYQGNLSVAANITTTGGNISGRQVSATAGYLHTTDGGNGIVIADNGDLYLRPASTYNVRADQSGLFVQNYIVTQNATDILKATTAGDIAANNHLVARYDVYANRDVYATGRGSFGSSISVGVANGFAPNTPAAPIAIVQRVGTQICMYDLGSGNSYGFGVDGNTTVIYAGGTQVDIRNGQNSGAVWFRWTAGQFYLQQNQSINWTAGQNIFPSGTTLYFRSGGSGASHLFQDSGGGWAPLTAGSISANGVMDASSWIRSQNGTYYMNTAGDRMSDPGDNNNWAFYGPMGSVNYVFQHRDSSWMGCQAANFQSMSDLSLKPNLATVTDAECVALVGNSNLPVVTWDPIGYPGRDIGFIAQDMEKVVPEVVTMDATSGLGSISYGNLTAVLWGALRNVDQRLQALEAKVP